MAAANIRNLLVAGALALLAACTTATGAGNPMIEDGQTFSIVPGERVTLTDHSTLSYVRLVADSRCPPDVQCIRAGDARIALQWTPLSGSTQDFTLMTPPEQPYARELGTRRLTLQELARGSAPKAQFRIERID